MPPRSYFYPCDLANHVACPAVDPDHRDRACDCGCHSRLSIACRLGGHDLCNRGACGCSCGHTAHLAVDPQAWVA